MSSPIRLYVFSSSNLTNIWAGIGASSWAVSQRDDSQMKGLLTKSQEMTVGSLGVFYCTEIQGLTTPFLVFSQPHSTEVVKDVWPETDKWVLPFRIHALGTPRRRLGKDQAMMLLPTLRAGGKTNITHALPIPAPTVFSPATLTSEDWAVLLEHLAE
jgi:hypothetical protein